MSWVSGSAHLVKTEGGRPEFDVCDESARSRVDHHYCWGVQLWIRRRANRTGLSHVESMVLGVVRHFICATRVMANISPDDFSGQEIHQHRGTHIAAKQRQVFRRHSKAARVACVVDGEDALHTMADRVDLNDLAVREVTGSPDRFDECRCSRVPLRLLDGVGSGSRDDDPRQDTITPWSGVDERDPWCWFTRRGGRIGACHCNDLVARVVGDFIGGGCPN